MRVPFDLAPLLTPCLYIWRGRARVGQIRSSSSSSSFSYPTSLALVMDEFLDIDLGDGAASNSESER